MHRGTLARANALHLRTSHSVALQLAADQCEASWQVSSWLAIAGCVPPLKAILFSVSLCQEKFSWASPWFETFSWVTLEMETSLEAKALPARLDLPMAAGASGACLVHGPVVQGCLHFYGAKA
mmetsp:Transcript_52828/g.153701  ORF Transcript_52828/g.153701 Transcript_52828/m.153701 type:complete len:123 (+) Transcript_52828:2336-2704(+)